MGEKNENQKWNLEAENGLPDFFVEGESIFLDVDFNMQGANL